MLSTSSIRLRQSASLKLSGRLASTSSSSSSMLMRRMLPTTTTSPLSIHNHHQFLFAATAVPLSSIRFCSSSSSSNNNNNKNNNNNDNKNKTESSSSVTEKKDESTSTPKVEQQEKVETTKSPSTDSSNPHYAGSTKADESIQAQTDGKHHSTTEEGGVENKNEAATTSSTSSEQTSTTSNNNNNNDNTTTTTNNTNKNTTPKGFELFYHKAFSRPPAKDDPAPSTVGTVEHLQILTADRHHNQATASKRISQLLIFLMVGYIFSKFWYRNTGAHQLGGEAFYYYDRTASEREEAKKKKQEAQANKTVAEAGSTKEGEEGKKSGENEGEEEGGENAAAIDTNSIYFPDAKVKYITVDPEQHAAVFYSEDGIKMFTQRFIDFGNWLRDIENRAHPENGPFVRMEVAIGFPVVAIAFLWLMPVLGRFYKSVNMGLGHARREAKEAVRKQQRASELETPTSQGRFRFKKETEIKTRLDDVAGLTEAKHEVTEIIDFLKGPEKYSSLGAKLPKGVLIDGPPGVGKTLLARAVAGEAGLKFVSCSGSEFDEVYVGVGAMRVRELFKSARENAPCVVFIDEIDTFGKKRKRDAKGTSRGTINALLSELDGFKESSRIMVLAATNRADILDDALTRSGRFDRKISVDLPPHKDRIAIALVHLKPLKLNPALELNKVAESIASLTPGCSGADLYNICNEAAIVASRINKDYVDMECFHKAMDRIMIGLERKARKFETHEKERLAIHEAGHVVLTWFLKTTDPIMKATIAPRGGSTEGTSRKLPHERFIITQEALHERMIARLGGYVAEEFFFSNISQNAAEDLARVTNEAKSEICTYGMNPAKVGHFGYPTNEEDTLTKPYSSKKANIVDGEISGLVTGVSDTARDMLKKYQNEVRMVAGLLVKQETVTAKELWVLLGERPHMSPEFRKYLESEA